MKKEKKVKTIYTVVTLKFHYIKYKINSTGKMYRPLTTKNERIVAWYPKFEDAEECILNNYGDIHELGHYPWAVIEKTDVGLYPGTEETWYHWKGHRENGRYVKAKKPKAMKIYCGWGIG